MVFLLLLTLLHYQFSHLKQELLQINKLMFLLHVIFYFIKLIHNGLIKSKHIMLSDGIILIPVLVVGYQVLM